MKKILTYALKIDGSTELFLLGCSHLPFPLTYKWFKRDVGGVWDAKFSLKLI